MGTGSRQIRPDDPPATIERLAHSPFLEAGRTRYGDATIYTAPSGALVFATGSMQWNWGLDGYNAPTRHMLRTSAVAQQTTRNVLNRMIQDTVAPARTNAATEWMPIRIGTTRASIPGRC